MELTKLQKRVQQMLDGERKRREVALEFVEKVAEIVQPVAKDIFALTMDGDGIEIVQTGNRDIYYRFVAHHVQDGDEYTGFYLDNGRQYFVWGYEINELRGPRFWWAIRTIMEWLPKVAELMEKKAESREKLLGLLK